MKKSLAITTIATILVIVVALTTATFAWFSSSSTTQATSNFTAQSSNALYNIYKYESGGTDTYSFTPNTLLTFDDITNGVTGQYGYWDLSETGLRAMAPQSLIKQTDLAGPGNSQGLPSTPFFTGSSKNGVKLEEIDVSKLDGTGFSPNVARFQLENAKSTPQAVKISVTVKPASESTVDINFASAMRFMIIAVPANGEGKDKGFVFGTEYSYELSNDTTKEEFDFSKIDQEVEGVKQNFCENAAYKTAKSADYSVGYEKYQVSLIAPKKATNTTGVTYVLNESGNYQVDFASYEKAKLAAGARYNVYLYVWLDGPTAGAQLSKGKVSFTMDFLSLGDIAAA